MTPEQARMVYEAMSPEAKEALAETVRKLGRMLREVEPVIARWQQAGIEQAEQYANKGERP